MKGIALAAAFVAAAAPLLAAPEEPDPAPQVTEVILDAPVEEAWRIFTTAEGWKSFGVAHASVDFRVGGKVLTHYDPKGTLGDPGTIENTILAYEPGSMVAFRATKAPAGFPFPAEILDRTWSVATFRDLGEGRTRVSLKGYGYGTDDASKKLRAFFERGNSMTLRMLAGRYKAATAAEDAPIEVSTVVAAEAGVVLEDLTTAEGWKRFLGVEARIERRIGGPFEILFKPDAPEGQRGSEGCTVQAWLPARMFAFTWNAPPKFPNARSGRTLVVVELEPEAPGFTRVRLTHDGWRERIAAQPDHAEEWRAVRAYFAEAWPHVLDGLVKSHAGPR